MYKSTRNKIIVNSTFTDGLSIDSIINNVLNSNSTTNKNVELKATPK